MKKYPNWNITLIESEPKLGGHANTIEIDVDGIKNTDDIGFMVFNRKTYPNFIEVIDSIKKDLFKSDMSFSASSNDKTWSSNKPINLKDPIYSLKILYEILKFNKYSTKELLPNETLGSFVNRHKFSKLFLDSYLFPMSCAIWSCDSDTIMNFSAKSFFSFTKNHGLTSVINQPQWLSFKEGSIDYVNYIASIFLKNGNQIFLNSKVDEIIKIDEKYQVKTKNEEFVFDKLILATHTDTSAKLIEKLEDDRKVYLNQIKYTNAKVTVHSDESFMPKDKSLWCSWNTLSFDKELLCTYWINNLQHIKGSKNIFVSLNCNVKDFYYEINLQHPLLDNNALLVRKEIDKINRESNNNLYFIGAWQGHGFHEDGWTSGKVLVNEIL